MTSKRGMTAYKNWAPDGVMWAEWVKPVLFADNKLAFVERYANIRQAPAKDEADFELKDIPADGIDSVFEVKEPPFDWLAQVPAGTAIILDLPGKAGVEEGMVLARKGYRPIPLYNGVYNLRMDDNTVMVPTWEIAEALLANADELPALNIDDDAPPVFLLDSNRFANNINKAAIAPGLFDNRWRVFPQDMPSAAFLKNHGIKCVLVHSKDIVSDLEHILYRYQKQGIVIRQYNGKDTVKVVRVSKPSGFKSLFQRYMVMAGLTRNSAGGFGGVIPDDSTSGGGG